MTVFACCGFPSRRTPKTKHHTDSDSSVSSAASDRFPMFTPEGFSVDFNTSTDVMQGSIRESQHRVLSSRVSTASVQGSTRMPNRLSARDRQGSACRSSLHSVVSSVCEDPGSVPDEEVARLRRALELTENELSRTEAELTEALVMLSREREENRKHRDTHHGGKAHLLQSLFHGSPRARRPASSSSRRRSGSCPQVLAILPPPTAATSFTIKGLISP